MRATEIAHLLAGQAQAVAAHLLPSGALHKRDWCCGSVSGEVGKSLRVCVEGSNAGLWVDHGGDDSDRGNLLDLWMRSRNLSLRDACDEAMDWLNIPADQRTTDSTFTPPPKRIETRAPSQTWLRLQPLLRPGTVTELHQLAELRHLPTIAGLELATRANHLFFAPVWDDGFEWPCWIITDSSRRNAQARRLDGQPFSGIGNKKAKTISGCEASWPVGACDLNGKHAALVEGGPDFLAAYHFIWLRESQNIVAPVAMFGASNHIHPHALKFFAGKYVWIFPHSDENQAGEKAARKWSAQLLNAGASQTDLFPLRAFNVKDLNDAVLLETVEDDA